MYCLLVKDFVILPVFAWRMVSCFIELCSETKACTFVIVSLFCGVSLNFAALKACGKKVTYIQGKIFM